LIDALTMAKTRYVDVILSNERVQQALSYLGEASSVLLPQVTVSASEGRQTKNLAAAGITLPGGTPLVGPFNTFDARLRLTQSLFDLSAVERLRAARARKALSLADYEKVRQDAIALVAALYVGAERAAQKLEAVHARLTRDAERLRIVQAQSQLGTSSSLDLKQAEAAYTSTLHQWHVALAEAEERRLDLAAALGLPSPQPIIFLPEELATEQPLPSSHDITATASQHPQVEAARALVRQQQALRDATRAEYLPRVSANAEYGASGSEPSDSEQTYGVGVQLSMPIFEGGRKYFSAREATSLVRESQARLTDAERHVEANTLSAIESLKQAHVLVEATETEMAASQQQLALVQSRHHLGTASELDLAEAQAQAAQARDQQDEASATYRLAQVNLAHAMGQMDVLFQEPGHP